MKWSRFDTVMLVILILLVLWLLYAVFLAAKPDARLIAKLAVVTASYLLYFLRRSRQNKR